MRRRLVLVVLLVAVSLGLNLAPAASEHEWANNHWFRRSGTYSYPPIHDRNSTVRQNFWFFENAANVWSDVDSKIYPYLSGAGGNPWDCSSRNWTIVVCITQFPADNTGYGVAAPQYFWEDGGWHLLSCVIGLRAGVNYSDRLLRAVATHELGHCLGLGHPNSTHASSVMTPNPALPNELPDAHDVDAMNTMYYNHWHY